MFSILLFEPSLTTAVHSFVNRTLGYQLDRDSPFSPWDWGQYHASGIPNLHVLQVILQVAVLALAGVVAAIPLRKGPLELAALSAAVLVGFELTLTHWSYLYIPWFLPFVLLALLLPRREPGPGSRAGARATARRGAVGGAAGAAVTTRTAFLALIAAVAALAVGLFVAELEGDAVITRHSRLPLLRGADRERRRAVPRLQGRVSARRPGPVRRAGARHARRRTATTRAFEALMVIALIAAAVLIVLSLVALGGSTLEIVLSVAAFLAGVALLGPFVLTRFDLYAATLTLAAVCAILHRRRTLGPVLLGIAIATKIYPAVLLPLLVARTWRRDGRPAALTALALSVGTSLLIYLPFAILAPEGVVRSVWRQLGRPLQIESLGSGVLLALHHALGMPLGWASGSGSQNLTGTVATVASAVTTVVGVAALAARLGALSRAATPRATRGSCATQPPRSSPSWRSARSSHPSSWSGSSRSWCSSRAPGGSPRSRCSSSPARSRACGSRATTGSS